MEKTPQYYIVEAAALPEIFRKVAEAKRMLETGETDKVNEAAKAVGISRSAFYKYRDTIAPFQNMMAGRIITFQLMLKHKAGILSEILSIFANCEANILTINRHSVRRTGNGDGLGRDRQSGLFAGGVHAAARREHRRGKGRSGSGVTDHDAWI